MIVVMRVQQFEVETPLPYLITLDFKPMIGYLPVYSSLEKAKCDFPDGPFMELQEE